MLVCGLFPANTCDQAENSCMKAGRTASCCLLNNGNPLWQTEAGEGGWQVPKHRDVWTDLEPGQDVEVLLHVSAQHLLYHSRPQSALISTGACLYTCNPITHMTCSA